MVGNVALDIRERTPHQLPLEVEIFNAAHPPEWHRTVEQMRQHESLTGPEDDVLRLLAFVDGRAVASGYVGHTQYEPPGRFGMSIVVHPEFQRRGIARELYRRLDERARAHEAQEVECSVQATMLDRVAGWLEREGFRETSRMRESQQDLTRFDFAEHAAAEERVEAAGITLTTLAAEDTEENRRRLWSLANASLQDVPFDRPLPDLPYDSFCQLLDLPRVPRDCLVIARDGERYVGYSILAEQNPTRAVIWSTGVDRDYRSRGVATAVKARGARLARARGYTALRTQNHTTNPAMLAVNQRLGYVPLPEIVFFVKQL